jgi:prepilin-type N-terminal cleavage/methylation domain-containing protein/prepilin-type processing-associated H-X9-DG protein
MKTASLVRLPHVRAAAPAPAFTLLELLVVIALVALLSSLLLPVLAGARSKGQTILCLNNHRQLILAWQLYADDHDDALPYNLGDEETRRTVAAGRYLNWVNNVMTWELDADNTNIALLSVGGLGPYVQGAARLYACPADTALSDLQRQAGWSGRVRSISMNAMVGDAGAFTTGGTNVNVPGYRQFFRQSQIPDAARIFVFLEEHPDSINDGYFLNKPWTWEWIDLPASYHRGAGNLAFADGHIETHQWLLSSTRPPARPDAAPLPLALKAEERADFDWLMERTSVTRAYQKRY